MANYRIPSDYKNQVPRANHNWSAGPAGTIHPCLAYPIHHRHVDAKSRIRMDPSVLIQSQALQGPLLNGFKYTTIAVFMPDSVLYGWQDSGVSYGEQQYVNFPDLVFDPLNSAVISSASYAKDEFFDQRQTRYSLLSRGLDLVGSEGGDDWFVKSWRLDYYDSEIANAFNHVGRGGLWDWLGVPPGAVYPSLRGSSQPGSPYKNADSFQWNIAPAICYFLSCYYYFMNVQENEMFYTIDAYTRSSTSAGNGVLGLSRLSDSSFSEVFNSFWPGEVLNDIEKLHYRTIESGYKAGYAENFSTDTDGRYLSAWLLSGVGAHGGLFSVPYSPDLFGNIVKAGSSPTAYIQFSSSDPDAAGQTGESVAVPEVRFKTKLQNFLDRLFVSRGRYGDVLRTLMGTKSNPYRNKPEFLGVWQASIDPTNVVTQSPGVASDGTVVDVGDMAGRIDRFASFKGSKPVDYFTTVPGTFMVISVLLPQPAYCQGLHPDLIGGTFADKFNPEYNGLGFMPVPRHRYTMMPEFGSVTNNRAWIPSGNGSLVTVDPNMQTIADEAAWSWLRTDYRRLHGELAQNGVYQYWALVRRFSEFTDVRFDGEDAPRSWSFDYFGTYGNPMVWQYLFAGTSLIDPNFTLLSDLRVTVTNEVSSNYMPYLGR